MKKKKTITLIASCMALFAGIQTSWGQNGVLLPQNQQVVTPRRGELSNPAGTHNNSQLDTIHGSKDVNVVFGAGESAIIDNQSVNWPAAGGNLMGGNTILVGSDESQLKYVSKNAVVGVYDNDGAISGALYNVKMYSKAAGGDNDPNYTGLTVNSPTFHVATDSIKYDKNHDPGDFATLDASLRANLPAYWPDPACGTKDLGPYKYPGSYDPGYCGSLFYPYLNDSRTRAYVGVANHVSGQLKTFEITYSEADTCYTSTRDTINKDDGKPLLITLPGLGTTEAKFQSTVQTAEYVRPTTILLKDVNTLDSIAIGEVKWYAACFAGTKLGTDHVGPFYAVDVNDCSHYNGWMYYDRDNYEYHWNYTLDGSYVDAAIRLLNNADVCVENNVADRTTLGTGALTLQGDTATTDAMLVVPGAKDCNGIHSNFRLKIGGDENMLITQDSGTYVESSNPLASAVYQGLMYKDPVGTGPGSNFPAQVDVYLTNGTKLWGDGSNASDPEVKNLIDYAHPRGAVLTDVTNGDLEKRIPYFATKGSVFGVHGAYNGGDEDGSLNGNIHTKNINLNDTTSIIEIGHATTNQDKFHIYSSGMLKNYRGCGVECDSLVIGVLDQFNPTDYKAPEFKITNDSMPLYIINDGTCCYAGITFNDNGTTGGITSLNKAITSTTTGKGDLHIQSHGFIKFIGADVAFTPKKNNNVKVLSDASFIYADKAFTFLGADTADLTIWAKGPSDSKRGCSDLIICDNGGAVKIDGEVSYDQINSAGGKLLLIRSENDDVLMGDKFTFKSTAAIDTAGEMMVQAGQDIRIANDVHIDHFGPRSVLFEAKKTVAFNGKFEAIMNEKKGNGDLTIKAGYPDFLSTADITNPQLWGNGTCVTNGYENREACHVVDQIVEGESIKTGGDIWFGGDAKVNMTPTISDSVDMYVRAYNTIHIDGAFDYDIASVKKYNRGKFRDTTMFYAETGNVEAMNAADITFDITKNDSLLFLIQAGNDLSSHCGVTCFTDEKWDGNVLFGTDKTLTITHNGEGPTLISAARDIENQEGADFTFNYNGDGLSLTEGDSLVITAGRHIETHAPYLIDYTINPIASIENKILMEAGSRCDSTKCKRNEYGSTLTDGVSYTNNDFSEGGSGNGSILLFSKLDIKYPGKGTIKLRALNGNIESDPYLHGSYPGSASIVFNHSGTGVTRMEAIDIKLHDKMFYYGETATDNNNGNLQIAAFDSILTRDIHYSNQLDKGNVKITTDKYKAGTKCDLTTYACSVDPIGIHQGHIVLGYGADEKNEKSVKDNILFDFNSQVKNVNTTGANLLIQAGKLGFNSNRLTGHAKSGDVFANTIDAGRNKAYGGNITFDYLKVFMAKGNGTAGGYTEISTPNGNIWGKDSINYWGFNGNLLVDAGLGSIEDLNAIRWSNKDGKKNDVTGSCAAGDEDILNTLVPFNCDGDTMWRTGNIMMKGGHIRFAYADGSDLGTGNATFRTREGFIDTYDQFTVDSMKGDILKYAGTLDASTSPANEWGDVSERDFAYNPIKNSGSVFFGADDNIMMNYGYSNGNEPAYKYGNNAGYYDVTMASAELLGKPNVTDATDGDNPYYYTDYEGFVNGLTYSKYNVNKNGYLWYKKVNSENESSTWKPRKYHRLYRGCTAPIAAQASTCSPLTGICRTIPNGARDLNFNFEKDANGADIVSGGVGIVAGDYIDMFTKFTYKGGSGKGMGAVPSMTTLNGEYVQGYGLYIKSLWSGSNPEKRRVSCFGCGNEGREMTYVGFHDDARIHAENQKALISAPVVEFFGHAELDAQSNRGSKTDLVVKGDSLIFHDSAIFDGTVLRLESFTTDAFARSDMRYGVVNDINGTKNYKEQGPAITMGDRVVPVLELGYQRCNEPSNGVTPSPNINSEAGKEETPLVGGDIVVTCKNAFALPIFNTVVANHARISFIASVKDGDANGGEYVNACVRTDLLRIRNKVEFYTDPADDIVRMGTLKMTTAEALPSANQAGIFPRHIHMEPGSELSLPGEDMLSLDRLTTVGGYGNIHENVFVKQDGIIAPGYASLMEIDCTSGKYQGKLTIHNLTMEKDATMRISIGSNNECYNENGEVYSCTQTDTLHVQDTIFFNEKVPLRVLQEDDYVEPGCYLFLIYDDTLGRSKERVKNLILEEKQNKNTGYYYSLDFTETGKVYLCVSTSPVPPVQRYVDLHAVEGVTTNPSGKYYVTQKQNVSFTATYADGQERQVKATGYYSQNTIILPGTKQVDGSYLYTIYNVVEPWDVYFDGYVANEGIEGTGVWTYKNTLHINVDKEDIVSIYNMTGVLYRKIEVPAGNSKFTLDRGMYIVTLKDGSVHKIVIK